MGTNLSTIKNALKALLAARETLAGVTVGYGAPLHADDVTADDGALRAIWFGPDSQARITIPYMVAGAKPTHEELSFDVVCQAIDRGRGPDGQLAADQAAETLLAEVLSELAARPSLGLTSPTPLACTAQSWTYSQLNRSSNAWGTRFVLTVATSPAGIAAPT